MNPLENMFNVANYPEREPDRLIAGNRWVWKRPDISDVYTPGTYVLHYHFARIGSPSAVYEVTTTDSDGVFIIEVEGTETGKWEAGDYRWTSSITRVSDSAQTSVDNGLVYVAASLESASEAALSWTHEVLIAIRAALKSAASEKQLSYTIGGRSIANRSYSELLMMEREFSKRWAAEKAELDREAGRATARRVLVTMGA